MPTANPRPGSILGTRVLRTEDPGLLTGAREVPGRPAIVDRLHAVFVRSDVAHAALGAVHVDDARRHARRRRRVHRRRRSAWRRTTASCRCTPTSSAPPLADRPRPLRRRADRRRPRRDRGAGRRTPRRGVGRLSTPLPTRSSTPRPRSTTAPPLIFADARLEPGAWSASTGRASTSSAVADARRARALRQPAHRRGADGAQRLRGRCPPTTAG